MSDRLLVSTRKGLFEVIRGKGGWAVGEAAFLGDNVTLALHDPRDGTGYAALNHGHFGVKLHRRDKGGAWHEITCPAYPPKPDGSESYNEGFVFLGEGELIPARVAKAPWLNRFQFSGEDVSLVMETHDGRQFAIGGTSFGGMPTIGKTDSVMPPLFQSISRYSWDGEEAYGMMERSNLREKVTLPA